MTDTKEARAELYRRIHAAATVAPCFGKTCGRCLICHNDILRAATSDHYVRMRIESLLRYAFDYVKQTHAMLGALNEWASIDPSARRYGKGNGNPLGTAENPDKCVETVYEGGNWSVYSHQCTRQRGHGLNGEYCKQHAKKHHARAQFNQPTTGQHHDF